MHDFINERWRPILAHNGLADFEALWKLEAQWFEPPNQRRGGWSGVARCELSLPGGGTRAIFLKRQENHGTFSFRHPVGGVPTFLREFRRIQHYRACGIPTLEPVYFAMRRTSRGHRAILATEELTGFVSMEDRVQRWLREGAPARPIRLRYLRAVAALLREMHAHGIQHNCFFPKHVFVRMNADGGVEARVIDLEKSRWRPHGALCARRDLYSLNYHSQCWSRSDRLRFYKAYLQIERLTPFAKWLWRHIAARSARKNRVRPPELILTAKPGVIE
ncbi:MAG: lipopolysaccharide kinase InaA family protein [Rhodocyclaceae bacterium]|jgi:hypothetical protein|nr:lipopolysaccharide kinase InaA family protein [Rhodocyclaceae bacterium]